MSQYLVICNTLLPAPPEVLDAFIAQCDYMDKLKEEGAVKMFVPFSGINGGFFVADVASNEDLSRIISGCPMFPYCEQGDLPPHGGQPSGADRLRDEEKNDEELTTNPPFFVALAKDTPRKRLNSPRGTRIHI